MTPPGPESVLIRNPDRKSWYLFDGPGRVLSATDHAGVIPLLREVEDAVESRGLCAAGFISYEASPAFDAALHTHPPDGFPLAWFRLCSSCTEIDDAGLPALPGEGEPLRWNATVSEDEYRAAIRQIRNRIAEGDTYQVNYSYRLRSAFTGDPLVFFRRIAAAQQTPFCAYLNTGRYAVCSASPELFFSLNGTTLTSRPMKGTSPRGTTNGDDRTCGERLRLSEKDRAENVMIVDMMRNDMGRVARTGTVRVRDLFALEKYPTLWQLTSTVEAETDAGVTDLLCALFPAASITGAPKPATMEIIRQIEPAPRRIYTGAIGTLFPGRKATFSVAIRTALVDLQAGSAEYGVGGGIVWRSTEEKELAESRIKASVVLEPQPEFSLLETMLWKTGEGYLLLEDHLGRMAESADYFSFRFSAESARACLAQLSLSFRTPAHRVRLLADRNGRMTAEPEPRIPPAHDVLPVVRLASAPVDSSDRFLYHKTTHRSTYERARSGVEACDDVMLWNERGELTESTIANLVAEIDGRLVTPPVTSGLLPGVYRRRMLEEGKVHEGVVTRSDLSRVTGLFLMNSVRGIYPVRLIR